MQRTGSERSSSLPSPGVLLALHFVPGGLVYVVYLATAGSLAASGVPPNLTLNLSFAIIGIPVIFGLLRFLAKRETGQSSIFAALRFRERLRSWQYFVLVPGFLVYAILISILLAPMTSQFQDLLGTSAPAWFATTPTTVGPLALAPWALFGVRLTVDGIAHPFAEELFFRGYLLPRLDFLGLWAPMIHGLLFATAHFWQPQNVPVLAAMVIPLYYAVWYFKSVRLSIIVHCAANIIGSILSITG